MNENEKQEFKKCADSFTYFCENYVKIDKRIWFEDRVERVPLKLYPEQIKFHEFCENNKWVIGTHYRLGGFTTVITVKYLWKCLFKLDNNIEYLEPMDRFARGEGYVIRKIIKSLPEWLKPELVDEGPRQFRFPETNSSMLFHGMLSTYNHDKKLTDLFFDNAAGARKERDEILKEYESVITDSNVIVLSVPFGRSPFFFRNYKEALTGKSRFKVFTCHYKNHPDYSLDWENKLKENLGEKSWQYEYEQKLDELV